MRRVAVISALLLPLPFAALPLLAVLMGDGGEPAGTAVVLTAETSLPAPSDPASIDARFDAGSMAYDAGCSFHGIAGS